MTRMQLQAMSIYNTHTDVGQSVTAASERQAYTALSTTITTPKAFQVIAQKYSTATAESNSLQPYLDSSLLSGETLRKLTPPQSV